MKQICTQLPNAIRGITLVEIMIALVLSLLLSAGALQVFISNKATYQTSEALTRIQENGRFAIDLLSREIRGSGFRECFVASTVHSVRIPTGNTSWMYDFANPLLGYEGSSSIFPGSNSSSVVPGNDGIPDAITVTQVTEAKVRITAHNTTDDTFTVITSPDASGNIDPITKKEIVKVVDCLNQQAAIFQNTEDTDNATKIGHKFVASGTDIIPGNCENRLGTTTATLGKNYFCSNPSPSTQSTPTVFGFIVADSAAIPTNNSKLFRQMNATFYIGDGRNNSIGEPIPSLHSINIKDDYELIEGIENMQILYGVDTDIDSKPETIFVTQYVTADQVPVVANWNNVISVRLFLLARSIEPTSGDRKPYTFMGTTRMPPIGDRYMRRQITVTIQVRNNELDQ